VGNYDAVLIGFGLPLPEPHPVAVQLTASAREMLGPSSRGAGLY